jgi:hypothetical protein
MLDKQLVQPISELLRKTKTDITEDILSTMSLEKTLDLLKNIQVNCPSNGIELKSSLHTELLDSIVLLELVHRYNFS